MNNRKYLSEVRPIFVVGGKILDLNSQYAQNREDNARHLAIAQNLIQNPNIVNVAKAAYHTYRGSQLGLPFSGKPEYYNPVNTGVAPNPTKVVRPGVKSFSQFTDYLRNTVGTPPVKHSTNQSIKIFEEYAKRDKDFLSRVTNKYIKDNNLQTFSGANGQKYIKTADGKVKSLLKLGRELLEGENMGEYWRLQ